MHLFSWMRTLLLACALAGGCSPSAPTTTADDPAAQAKRDQANRDRARIQVEALSSGVEQYKLMNDGNAPPSLQDLTQPQPNAGGTPITAADKLIDPWGKPYQYDPAGPKNNGTKPDVWTQAPDGTVIGNWRH
jgi:hypothetical protein